MSPRFILEIKEEAKEDIANAYDWYEEKLPGLGGSFKKHVGKTIKAIQKTPKGFKIINGNRRQVPVNKFPFVIIYELFENTIVVFAVFHTSKNPDKKPVKI